MFVHAGEWNEPWSVPSWCNGKANADLASVEMSVNLLTLEWNASKWMCILLLNADHTLYFVSFCFWSMHQSRCNLCVCVCVPGHHGAVAGEGQCPGLSHSGPGGGQTAGTALWTWNSQRVYTLHRCTIKYAHLFSVCRVYSLINLVTIEISKMVGPLWL